MSSKKGEVNFELMMLQKGLLRVLKNLYQHFSTKVRHPNLQKLMKGGQEGSVWGGDWSTTQ